MDFEGNCQRYTEPEAARVSRMDDEFGGGLRVETCPGVDKKGGYVVGVVG